MNYDEFGNEIYVDDKELTYEKLERIAASKVRGSILWMVLGLFITGITGYYFINSIIKYIKDSLREITSTKNAEHLDIYVLFY